MPTVSINLSPTAYAFFMQWPVKSINDPGRSYEVSHCVVRYHQLLDEVKELRKEILMLEVDKLQMDKMIQEAGE